MEDAYSVVVPDDVEQEPFPESGLLHRKLTAPLGCRNVRVNTVTLQPGESTAPHTHERQEEVYVALDGGHVHVAEHSHEVPPGGLVRIGPDPLRNVSNETEDDTQTWLMIGAPPHGSLEDYGEYVMPDEES